MKGISDKVFGDEKILAKKFMQLSTEMSIVKSPEYKCGGLSFEASICDIGW